MVALSLAGCEPAAGTVINSTDQPVFVIFGTDDPRLYVAAGQSIASDHLRPTGPVTVFSPGMGRVRCAQGTTDRTGRWRMIVSGAGGAMTCFFY